MLPLLACWLVLGGLPALAQIPQSTPPPITSIPTAPAPATATRPAPPEKDDVPRMLYPNAPISEILAAYELLTGKQLLAGSTVAGTINIVINRSVTKAQAISILETALTLNGFSLVPGAGDIVKVLGLGDQVRSKGVPIYSDLADVPQNEQAVSFFLRLRYLDAQDVANFLQLYIPANNSVGFSPLQKSGAIIITDTANNVRRVVSLLAQIDVPAAPVVEKFIRLERADATKAVEFLNTIFETKTAGASSGVPNAAQPPNGNVRRPIRRLNEEGQVVPDLAGLANVPGGLIALSGESIIQGRITLTADVRTNRVHVVTQPVNLPLVENLIAEYDSDTPFAEPVRRPLRFVSARDVLPILVQALTEPGNEQGQNGNNLTPGSPQRQSNPNSNTNNLFNNNNGNSNGGFGSSGGGGNSSLGSEGLNTEAVDTTPTEAVVGSTKIIADQSANTIILLGGAEAKDKVFQILDQLDVRPAQVIIRAVIGELSLGNSESTGLNYLLRQKGVALESKFNSTLSGGTTPTATAPATLAATNSSTLQTLTNLAAGVGTGFSGLGGIVSITNSFDIILSALQSSNRFKTVSRPMIFTRNNKKAIIASGQEIAVPTQSLSSASGTTIDNASVATNVQFKSVTLKLEVVPLINSAGEVTLDILQTIDSIASGQSVQIGGNLIPTIATRYIKSNVQAPNKSTIVLGGLTTSSESKTSTDIPYLSKIPLLGDLLFKSRTRDQNRSELIVLLSPEVDNAPDTIEQKRRDEERRLSLGANLEDQLLPVAPAVRKTTRATTRTVRRAEAIPSPK